MQNSLLLILVAACLAVSCRPRVGSERLLKTEAGYNSRLPKVGKPFVRHPMPGRYVGFSKGFVATDDRFLPTTADLVLYNVAGIQLRYVAVVRMSLGHHVSPEYVTFYSDKIAFDSRSGQVKSPMLQKGPYQLEFLTLDEDAITFTVWENRNRVAAGRLKLFQGAESPVLEAKKAAPRLTGQYESQCKGETQVLQLELGRTPPSLAKGRLFPGYILSGRLGSRGNAGCTAQDGMCVESVYSDGRFHLFTGVMELPWREGVLSCRQQQEGLKCGDCLFRSVAKNSTKRRVFYRRKQTEVGQKMFSETHSFDWLAKGGVFQGRLHHEAKDAYQQFRLSVSKGGQQIQAALVFGASESLQFDLKESSSNPALGLKVFDGVGNGFLKLYRVTANSIVGVWYSKTFGRVGTVELTRGQTKDSDSTLMTDLKGVYDGPDLRYGLVTRSGNSATYDDAFPAVLSGWAQSKKNMSQKQRTRWAYYDPYTFQLSLQTVSGQTILGEVGPGSSHQVIWSDQPTYGVNFRDHVQAKYRQETVVH